MCTFSHRCLGLVLATWIGPCAAWAGYVTPGYTPTNCVPGNPVCLYINGNTPNTLVNGLNASNAPVTGAFIDAYDSQDALVPSSFAPNFVAMGNGTFQSDPVAFSSLAKMTQTVPGSIAQELFMFVLDSQETNNAPELQFERIRLLVNGTPVWTMTDAVVINTTTNTDFRTRSTLSNGADLALFVPVHLFNSLNLTGSSTFVFEVTESLNNNGNDEWRLVTSFTGVTFFSPTDPIYAPPPPAAVPEPASALVVPAAAAVWAWRRRRSRA